MSEGPQNAPFRYIRKYQTKKENLWINFKNFAITF